MRQLFEGVQFMHGRDCVSMQLFNNEYYVLLDHLVVHRDLKLENILCIDEKRVVISDFGFAKQLEQNQRLRGCTAKY